VLEPRRAPVIPHDWYKLLVDDHRGPDRQSMELWFAALETMPVPQQIDIVRAVMLEGTWMQLARHPRYSRWISTHADEINTLSMASPLRASSARKPIR
jgi:hypothetical protein